MTQRGGHQPSPAGDGASLQATFLQVSSGTMWQRPLEPPGKNMELRPASAPHPRQAWTGIP